MLGKISRTSCVLLGRLLTSRRRQVPKWPSCSQVRLCVRVLPWTGAIWLWQLLGLLVVGGSLNLLTSRGVMRLSASAIVWLHLSGPVVRDLVVSGTWGLANITDGDGKRSPSLVRKLNSNLAPSARIASALLGLQRRWKATILLVLTMLALWRCDVGSSPWVSIGRSTLFNSYMNRLEQFGHQS